MVKFPFFMAALLLAGCADQSSRFAPTGAKGITDEFGRQVFLDEECGGLERHDYAEYFQNAMFRDGQIARERLWMVDGTHLWSAPVTKDPTQATQLQLEVPFLGHGNAIAASEDLLAIAMVDRGVVLFPDYDVTRPVYLAEVGAQAMDVAVHANRMAVAAGSQGVLVFDVGNPASPYLTDTIATGGHASGVRWGENGILYFSACSYVGWASLGASPPAVRLSGRLSHTNAKDAHGNGTRLVAANNGGGVWFFDMEHDLTRSAIFELQDPNFYANAVFVKDEFGYVAAGNREIIALWIDGDYKPEPRASLPRDPLGIAVHEQVVYGFGNFRDVGERTVVRTRELDDSPSAPLQFEKGYRNWLEPRTHAIWSRDGGGKQWLTRREAGGYRVYSASPTSSTWRPEPDYQFYYAEHQFAISVSSDNQVRVFLLGATEPVVEGEWFSAESLGENGFVQFDFPVLKLSLNGLERAHIPLTSLDALDSPDGVQAVRACEFRSSNEEWQSGNSIAATDVGAFFAQGDVNVESCSRLVDPYLPTNRKADDFGAKVSVCERGRCYAVNLRESGVVGVLPLGNDHWVSLVDDRVAYTTSLAVWQPVRLQLGVYETGQGARDEARFVAAEVSRYVFRGRPEGWRLLPDGTIRGWMADGTAFTFDAARNTASDFVTMEAR